MKTIFTSAIAIILFIGTAAFLAQKDEAITLKPANSKGFAVLELFTSEGCSSCPPADALLSRLQQQDTAGQLYILAFHVDYWDHQGWKDRFSTHAYSERQQQYADWLELSNIYTPQLVVNGEKEFVGSNAAAVENAVNHALTQPPTRHLKLSVGIEGHSVVVRPGAETAPGMQLLVALVQKQAESRVKGGENEGRQLVHVQIVRDLKTLSGKAVKLSLPAGYTAQQWEVIGFVQEQRSGKITDAVRVSL